MPRERIVDDYALSAGYFARPMDDPHITDWRVGSIEVDSPPEYMESSLEHLDSQHGGAAMFLRDHGLTGPELQALIELLTEPAPD